MKTCAANYVNFVTEPCALKKIHNDIYKNFEKGHTGFFQDCELTPWTPRNVPEESRSLPGAACVPKLDMILVIDSTPKS